jgi:hypothetical protein
MSVRSEEGTLGSPRIVMMTPQTITRFVHRTATRFLLALVLFETKRFGGVSRQSQVSMRSVAPRGASPLRTHCNNDAKPVAVHARERARRRRLAAASGFECRDAERSSWRPRRAGQSGSFRSPFDARMRPGARARPDGCAPERAPCLFRMETPAHAANLGEGVARPKSVLVSAIFLWHEPCGNGVSKRGRWVDRDDSHCGFENRPLAQGKGAREGPAGRSASRGGNG